MTITTSAIVSISSNSTSLTEAWIGVVRSVRVVTLMPLGRVASSCGSSRLMLFDDRDGVAARLALAHSG